jgi:sugar/nucleoside kinase (ribokinase family)
MSLLVVGTVAFDAIETPFGKTDKIVGGAASYIALAASYFDRDISLVSVIGDDFPEEFLSTLSERYKRIAERAKAPTDISLAWLSV